METITLKMPLIEAKSAFASVLPHISKDTITPVITCAQIGDSGIIGTDRYTVARHGLSESPSEPFMIHHTAVAWIAQQNTRTLADPTKADGYQVTIEAMRYDPDNHTRRLMTRVAVSSKLYGEERMMKFDQPRGNFPPISRLFEQWEAAQDAYPVGIKPEMMQRVNDWARRYHPKTAVRWELGKKAEAGIIPAPFRATIGDFAALVQPHLILK